MEVISSSSLILVTLVAIITYLLYSCVLKIYWDYNRQRQIVSSSYKVLARPYSLFGTSYLNRQKTNLEKYGDSQHHMKFVVRDYQLCMNVLNGQVVIDLIDPQLIREFYERTLEGCYVKAGGISFLTGLKAILGTGLLFSEGHEWKKKRRIMSIVFNYDFIKAKIPVIAAICNDVLNELEGEGDNVGKEEVKADTLNVLQRIFGNVVVKCFFGDLPLKDIEGESIFSFLNNLLEKNTKRSMTLYAYALGRYFHKLNIRKVDRDIARDNQNFQRYATSIIQEYVTKVQESKASSDKDHYEGVVDLLIKQNKFQTSAAEQDEKEGASS
jgi:cytochrome P450